MKRFSTAITLVVAIGGGGCQSASNPVAPAVAKTESPATFTVSGVVTEVTATGVAPVTGATVEETRFLRGTTTDSEGRYQIAELAAGRVVLRFLKSGYITSLTSVDLNADVQVNIRVVAPTPYILSGVVFELTPAGRVAVENALLYCDSCGSPDGHTFTNSDAQGGYAFEWSINGVHLIHVSKDGYALARPAGRFGRTEYVSATVNNSDTRLDIEVVRR